MFVKHPTKKEFDEDLRNIVTMAMLYQIEKVSFFSSQEQCKKQLGNQLVEFKEKWSPK